MLDTAVIAVIGASLAGVLAVTLITMAFLGYRRKKLSGAEYQDIETVAGTKTNETEGQRLKPGVGAGSAPGRDIYQGADLNAYGPPPVGAQPGVGYVQQPGQQQQEEVTKPGYQQVQPPGM